MPKNKGEKMIKIILSKPSKVRVHRQGFMDVKGTFKAEGTFKAVRERGREKGVRIVSN